MTGLDYLALLIIGVVTLLLNLDQQELHKRVKAIENHLYDKFGEMP